ncbi:MAG: hypothetical protein AAF799_07655 [Myxococcota bacterium]
MLTPRLSGLDGADAGAEVGPSPSPTPRPRPRIEMRRDGPPRSLTEAGFRKRKDGSFVMRRAELPFVVRIDAEGRMSFRDQQLKVGHPMVEKIRTAVRNAKDPANAPPIDAKSLIESLSQTIGSLSPMVYVKLPRLDDLIRKGSGQEINTHLKLIFLEGTAELRHRMARTHAEERLNARLDALDKELQTLWYRSGLPAAQRREALFQLWDDCIEAPPRGSAKVSDEQELERLRQSIAAKARKEIIQFIRRHVGQGTEDGYSAEELQRLNARRGSRERFTPYPSKAAPTPPPPP